MKKIAYIELDTHAEIALYFMDLMEDSSVFSVDYFFSGKISKQIGRTSKDLFVTDSSKIIHQLNKKNYDLVIIGTVHRYFDVFLKITRNFNTSVLVHNLNFSRISTFQLFKNIFKKDFKYRLKLLLKEGLLHAPQIYATAKHLLVLDQGLSKENQDLNLEFLPLFYLCDYEKPQRSNITIVIPGTVSQQRRNYLHVLNCLQNFQRSNRYQLVFLGKVSGQELSWLKVFEEQKIENISFTYFTEKLPQRIFDKWMRRADILWCPLQNETEFFSQKELYGVTKMSGNVGDAIKYGKLAIFPKGYPNIHPFIIPESNNVEEQILAHKNGGGFGFREHFAKDGVRKDLEETLNGLV